VSVGYRLSLSLVDQAEAPLLLEKAASDKKMLAIGQSLVASFAVHAIVAM